MDDEATLGTEPNEVLVKFMSEVMSEIQYLRSKVTDLVSQNSKLERLIGNLNRNRVTTSENGSNRRSRSRSILRRKPNSNSDSKPQTRSSKDKNPHVRNKHSFNENRKIPKTPRRFLIVGTRETQENSKSTVTLPKVNLRICTAKIFVSGQEPSITASAMNNHLTLSGITPTSVTKLKTKFGHYSSFCIEVPDTDVDSMFDEQIWNSGAVVKEFSGTLDDDKIVECFPRSLRF